ncbi:MAG: SIS domain-containing protein, partial [bacterium]|nr:SIS domain-containing protein [bacterium]
MSKFIGYIGKTKNISTVSELLAKNNNLECVYRNDKEFLISKDINDVSNFKSSTTIISTGDIIKNDVFTICGTVTIDNYDGDKNKNGLTFILDKLTTLYLQDKDVISALDKIKNYIDGSYAIIILLNTDVSLLYATKYNYPLYITFGPCENFLSFDITNIIKLHENYIKLSNDEIAVLKENNMLIYKNKEIVNKPIKKLKWTKEVALKNGYEHYMLKEIWETPTVINNSIDYLMKEIVDLSKYKEIDIVACGSAYNSGLIGSYLIEKYSNIKVRGETSSEYRYKKGILSNEKLVIVISQSGETTDSLASLKLAKKCKNDTLAITNVAGSSIAKE